MKGDSGDKSSVFWMQVSAREIQSHTAYILVNANVLQQITVEGEVGGQDYLSMSEKNIHKYNDKTKLLGR